MNLFEALGESASEDLSPLKEFRLRGILGKSGFTTILRVWSQSQKKFYVLKQFDLTSAVDVDIESSMNEARMMIKLVNPHVINCHLVHRTSSKLYIVMDWCDQKDLGHYLK